jgi:hypothetical protein
LLRTIADAARASTQSGAYFTEAPAQLRVLSSLAEGSDRTVATDRHRCRLHAACAASLFPRRLRRGFRDGESCAEYRDCSVAPKRVFELPGDRADLERGYDLAARASSRIRTS